MRRTMEQLRAYKPALGQVAVFKAFEVGREEGCWGERGKGDERRMEVSGWPVAKA